MAIMLLRTMIVSGVLLLAACTGAGAPATDSDGEPTAGAATESPVEDGGDGAVGSDPDWCLNTLDEVSDALQVEAADAVGAAAPGVGGGCNYTDADGNVIYGISVVTNEAAVDTFEANRGSADVEGVEGVGDDAMLMSPQGPLVILVGDAFVSIGAIPPVPMLDDPAAYRDALEQLGAAASDRVP